MFILQGGWVGLLFQMIVPNRTWTSYTPCLTVLGKLSPHLSLARVLFAYQLSFS